MFNFYFGSLSGFLFYSSRIAHPVLKSGLELFRGPVWSYFGALFGAISGPCLELFRGPVWSYFGALFGVISGPVWSCFGSRNNSKQGPEITPNKAPNNRFFIQSLLKTLKDLCLFNKSLFFRAPTNLKIAIFLRAFCVFSF